MIKFKNIHQANFDKIFLKPVINLILWMHKTKSSSLCPLKLKKGNPFIH